MIVRATVEIEFEVPEGTDLIGPYVTLRATLNDGAGNQLADAYDCKTKDVEVRFRRQTPRYFREKVGGYLYDTGLVDNGHNHMCRFARRTGDLSSVITDWICGSEFAACTEVSREQVPAEWLAVLDPEAK
jgi:hypothetical protein